MNATTSTKPTNKATGPKRNPKTGRFESSKAKPAATTKPADPKKK
jgi:hypothetical protein